MDGEVKKIIFQTTSCENPGVYILYVSSILWQLLYPLESYYIYI